MRQEPDGSASVGSLAFVELAGAVGVPADLAVELHRELVARHGEPHRRYHTLDHVGWVLHHLDTTASALPDRRAVDLAAWYHDAVYEPLSGDNEAASARLAAARLSEAGADREVVADVVRLVEATAGHQPSAVDEAALCDADLAVLGADPDGYADYVRGVRAEYRAVDDAAWAAGRTAVLRSLLALPRLYHHPAFAEREQRARANLAAELDALEAPGSP